MFLQLAQRVLQLSAALHPALKLAQTAQFVVVRFAVDVDRLGGLVQHGIWSCCVAPELKALVRTRSAADNHAVKWLLAHGTVAVVHNESHAHGALATDTVMVALAYSIKLNGIGT